MNLKKFYLQVMFALVLSVFLCGSALAENLAYFQGKGIYEDIHDDDTNSSDYLNPAYGGQAYDAEFLAIGLSTDRTRLYFGLQTGIELKYGDASTSGDKRPGDLAINFGNDATWDYGIRFWTNGFSLLDASSAGWADIHYPAHSVSAPWRVDALAAPGDALDVTNALFAFSDTTDTFGNATNLLEGWIDASAFGLTEFSQAITVNWTMYCGNDYVRAGPIPIGGGNPTVPEPTTILLFGMGLLGLAGFGRKKN